MSNLDLTNFEGFLKFILVYVRDDDQTNNYDFSKTLNILYKRISNGNEKICDITKLVY